MSTFTIPTKPNSDFIFGRNGAAKLAAIQVMQGEKIVFIDGINTRGNVVSNAGFSFNNDPAVLRQLAHAFNAMAVEVEGNRAQANGTSNAGSVSIAMAAAA